MDMKFRGNGPLQIVLYPLLMDILPQRLKFTLLFNFLNASKISKVKKSILFSDGIRMTHRVLILGSNRGIGLELVKSFANEGMTYTV